MERTAERKPLSSTNFTVVDTIVKANKTWNEFRDVCKDNRGLDWGFRYLCSHKDNTGTVDQNARGNKRCALPWCPHRKRMSIKMNLKNC